MVEINVKSMVIGISLGVLLCLNLSKSFCDTSSFQFQSENTGNAPQQVDSDSQMTTQTTASATSPSEGSSSSPHPMFQSQYDKIDSEDMHQKCARYNLKYDPSATPRRIFFGSMVANDAIEMLRIHATEVYGLYDVMIISESNTTHMNTPRDLRFIPGKEAYEFMNSGVWGPNTKVHISYWLEKAPNVVFMGRERRQRNTIVQGWIEEGMTENDIAIMSDMDETFTRDYLLAMKFCEPPESIRDKSCKKPKLLGESLVFQSSPECINERSWYHPDWALGQCVEGVGDASIRVPRKRAADLAPDCGGGNYCRDNRPDLYDPSQIKDGMYPLMSGTDLRELPQGDMVRVSDGGHTHTAFHFHNMFADLVQLRHKYATYAHGSESVARRPLGLMEHDLDVLVRCAHGYPNEINPEGRKRHDEGYVKFTGSKPIYFANATYRKERHTALVKMMVDDEQIWGKTYNDSFVTQFLQGQAAAN